MADERRRERVRRNDDPSAKAVLKRKSRKVGKQWIAQWWEGNHRRKARWSGMTKSEAEKKLTDILAPLNEGHTSSAIWKPISSHLDASMYGSRSMNSFNRNEFQELLNQKAIEYSYSVVAHLRWTLRQIFRMAVVKAVLSGRRRSYITHANLNAQEET